MASHTETDVLGEPGNHGEPQGLTGDGRTASGYALVLPPGWRKIPVRHGTDEAIREILDEVLGRVGTGPDREKLIRVRVELQGRLSAMAVRAREASGVDLYLPVEYVHGTPVPASFSVSEGAPGSPGGAAAAGGAPGTAEPAQPLAPEELIAYLASADDATSLVALDGAPGVRTDHVAAADPGQDAPLPSRQVDYVVTIPGSPDRWLMVVFSTVGDGDPNGQFAGILVELFDAIMSTFRWTWPGQEPGQRSALPGQEGSQ
ncbi:MAG TPA: hypothetical protein VFV41_24000 [Streptosporangiaceae bacterium]|nr:hypothetical protein [Streptosporangiaceae bacterium]